MSAESRDRKKKIMAMASMGGHWVQLRRLHPVWQDQDVVYVSTDKSLKNEVNGEAFESVVDANMDQKFKLLIQSFSILWLVIKHRPNVIISTGAAVGFFGMFWGRLFGVKTVWVDSVANAEELSLAGKKVKRFASVWLTQWPNLESKNGPVYKGRVF